MGREASNVKREGRASVTAADGVERMGETKRWDAAAYDERHGYVWQHGAGVVELLAPQPGERILDLGCGTGHLTAKIAEAGASVVGMDSSPGMVEQARANYPELAF